MNIHTLSYTRQVSRSCNANEAEFSIFKGSSLTRKKYERKNAKEDQEEDNAGIQSVTAEQAPTSAHQGKADKRFTLWERTVSGAVTGERSTDNDYRYSHRLSPRTKNKIKEKIFALYGCCTSAAKRESQKSEAVKDQLRENAEFTFLTLTFIGQVDDIKAQKCLNKFLTVLRTTFGRFLYIWVAERQTENKLFPGNIHFHFITNRRFPIQKINALWVYQQLRAGIRNPTADQRVSEDFDTTEFINRCKADQYDNVTCYSSKEVHHKVRIEDLYKAGLYGFIGQYLNPADIEEIKNVDALSGYLTGYITKNNAEFTCSAWHCCRGVSALFTGQIVAESVVSEVKNEKFNFSISKKGKFYSVKPKTITNKDTGKTVAVVSYILNKQYFRRHLKYVDCLNDLILSDYLEKKEVSQTFIMDRGKFFDYYYSQLNMN